jgi:uncharacterized protein (TIGR04206 family)
VFRTPGRTVPALLALLAVPWSVQTYANGPATFVFPWGLVGTTPFGATTLPAFLFVHTDGLPEFILSWPLSVAMYVLAVGFAVVAPALGYDDPRVVAGLLVVAGVAQFSFAWGFSIQPGRTAWPVGTAVLWLAAWLLYRPRANRRAE